MQPTDEVPIPRSFPPCASVSKQAREFISQSDGAQWEAVDLSGASLASLRNDNKTFGKDGWDLVKDECPVVLSEDTVGGVSCQWIQPSVDPIQGNEFTLFIHGGAFVVGSPDDDLSMTARIAVWLGRRVCAPRYRLAPENPFPAARDDILSVYRALASSGHSILVVGESAGGNLALGLVIDLFAKFSDLSKPLAVALFSPWIDLTHSGDSHSTLFGLDPTLSVQHFLKPASLAYAGKDISVSDPAISPLFADIPETAKT